MSQANKRNYQDNELARRDSRKKNTRHLRRERKPKQTVTLTTVPEQKAQEKSLNGTYRLQSRPFRESPLCLYYHDNHTGYTTETTTS